MTQLTYQDIIFIIYMKYINILHLFMQKFYKTGPVVFYALNWNPLKIKLQGKLGCIKKTKTP